MRYSFAVVSKLGSTGYGHMRLRSLIQRKAAMRILPSMPPSINCPSTHVVHSPRSPSRNQTSQPIATVVEPRLALTTSLSLVLPAPFYDTISSALLPGSLAGCQGQWLMQRLVGTNSVSMGLPGVISIGIFLNPMFEVVPRIRRDKDVAKLPLLPYSAMAAQGMVWTYYGVIIGNPAIWTPNLCALVLGLYYCRVHSMHCPADADWLPYKKLHHVWAFLMTGVVCLGSALLLPTASALTVLGLTGNVMTILMFGGPLAAVRTVLRDRSTRSVQRVRHSEV